MSEVPLKAYRDQISTRSDFFAVSALNSEQVESLEDPARQFAPLKSARTPDFNNDKILQASI